MAFAVAAVIVITTFLILVARAVYPIDDIFSKCSTKCSALTCDGFSGGNEDGSSSSSNHGEKFGPEVHRRWWLRLGSLFLVWQNAE